MLKHEKLPSTNCTKYGSYYNFANIQETSIPLGTTSKLECLPTVILSREKYFAAVVMTFMMVYFGYYFQ